MGDARCMRVILRQCGLCKRNQWWLIVICPRVSLDGITGSEENASCFTIASVQQDRVPLLLIGEEMILAHDSDESLARYGLVEDPALVLA
mgnify:CR=1 FL=1